MRRISDIYTLEFKDGEVKISKAELSTLGNYFTSLFASGMQEAASKTISLKDLETEQFDDYRTYVRDFEQYNLDDPDTARTLKTLAGRFNPLPVYPNSMTLEQWANPAAFLATLPPMPQALVDFLDGPCPLYPGKKAGETHIVVPLVKNITTHKKGVSVTKPRTLKTLDKFDKDSGGAGCRHIWGKVLSPDVDKPAEVEFEWAVLTKGALPRSTFYYCPTYDSEKRLAEEKGYQVPGILDAVTCLLWATRYSGITLGRHHPWTVCGQDTLNNCDNPWTVRCQDMLEGYYLIANPTPDGIEVYSSGGGGCVGVMGLRKF